MITLEYLAEQKAIYQTRIEYFTNLGFDILATDFQGVLDLISNIEECIKEKEKSE